MEDKPIDQELLKKIKDALVKSGFPLEMNIANILDQHRWDNLISTQYLDFETRQIRESDIIASKIINGIEIKILIECKKSTEKQLVLYQPQRTFFVDNIYGSSDYFKIFPYLDPIESIQEYEILSQFYFLPILYNSSVFSSNLIFTKGNNIEQNNTPFFTSLNGLLKRSIIIRSRSNRNIRSIYLYVVIYEGHLLRLTTGNDSKEILEEIDYGQYKMQYFFQDPILSSEVKAKDIQDFGDTFLIEIMKPSYLVKYLDGIMKAFKDIDTSLFDQWGEEAIELPF
ncbi:hypothetical protein ACS5NO_20765 [Larkinella sp. GY13]|uniref:hypothetical protein n=1 Tax=Larkinella sp. GY13 TaxID=3453720 RepID=UPI003EEEE59D